MRKAVIACLLLFPLCIFGQRFGGTPPSVKWKQINTDTARIIFPAGLDSQAQRIATVIHHEAAVLPVPLGDKLHKIDIVLQNQTTIANGYVGLGPYRSEFYLTPALSNFQLGSISWPDQLAIHEYRHVQQFNNFHNGLSNLMYYLFGQEGYALAINASIPDWFYEGDAVYNETILSKQGRGRLPLFMNAYPTLWQAGKKYSWMKLRNGSMKDYVPNHYNLGYLLVNYGREKYGADFWSKVTKDASAFKGLFYPFQKAVKKYAGVDYKTFRNDAFNYYKNLEKAAPATKGTSVGEPVYDANKHVVTNYMFPYTMSSREMVYLKTAYNKRPSFYIKDQIGEKRLRTRDISIDDQFSYRGDYIVYASYRNDPRWSWRDYSVINVLNIHTGQQRTITRKSKYFTPDISPNSSSVAAVQIDGKGHSELHILDSRSGDVKQRLGSPDIQLFTDPKFINDDSLVCAVRLKDGKMALAVGNLQTGSLRRLTPPSFNVVGYPCVTDGIVYFTASYGGNDDIFAIKPNDTSIYRITNGTTGNYFVNVGNGKMTWSSFTAEGYQLMQANESELVWTKIPSSVTDNTVLAYPVSQENRIDAFIPGNLAQRSFPTSKYSKGTRLFNFHSWRPYYEDPEFSFSLYGENVLNTLQTELYYLYNQDEKTNAVGVTATFGQLFPYISIGTQYIFDRTRRLRTSANTFRVKQWGQLDSRIGLSIPLDWAKGRTYNQLNFGSNFYYTQQNNKGLYKDSFELKYSSLHHFISWGQQAEMAAQHIFPKWGYNLSLENIHAITNYHSWQWLARGSVYLPGALASHSIVITGAFQQTDTVNALYGNRFPFSRGYTEDYFARMWRISANYHLPLLYPDWGFGNILYLQRIRGNLFYDMTRIDDLRNTADQRSAGAELFFDTKWWNQYSLTFGIRFAHLLDRDLFGPSRRDVIEFILPVSIIPR